MTRNERRKKAIEQEMARYSQEIKDIWKKADDDDRETSADERGEVEERLKAIENLKSDLRDVEASIKVEDQVNEVSRGLGEAKSGLEFSQDARVVPGSQDARIKSIGDMFIESAGYKSAAASGFSGNWTTGMVEFGTKGTLLEGSGSPGSGSGGGFMPVPQVIPGVVQKLFQRLSIADLLASGVATGNTLRYVVEGTATSGAAGVAEGGAKPESILGTGTKDEPIKKIATMLVVSDEMMEDAPQVSSYINSRLSLFVQIEEERQLLRGAGTDALVGLMDASRAINILSAGTTTAGSAMANLLFRAMNGTRGSSFLEPTGWVIHPTDWQTLRLATDTAGQYFGGGPFQGPYSGNGQNLPQSPQVTGNVEYLWNKPVVVTTALGGAGTALCGAFDLGAQVWRRSGLSVEATNSHGNLFANNLVAIRAEERLGLAVYRPSAFTEVRF